MVTTESFSKIIDKDVFTDKGAYCGKITDMELDLEKFRVRALVIAAKGSYLSKYMGSKKGIVVPFQMVVSMGDVVIIKNIASSLPSVDEMDESVAQKPGQPF